MISKRKDGTYQDIAHPINNDMRKIIEDQILVAYEDECNKPAEEQNTVASEE